MLSFSNFPATIENKFIKNIIRKIMNKLFILFLCCTGSLLQASLLQKMTRQLPRQQARFAGCLALTDPSQDNSKTNCKATQCKKAQERMINFSKFHIENNQKPSFTTILRMDPELAEAQDPEGNTLLHHAAKHNDFSMTEALAPASQPNAVNNLGQTPLMALVLNSLFIRPAVNLRVAHYLLKFGASPHITDANGNKPSDLLPTGADPEFRKFIEAATYDDA
jgi:hypothetical protein